MIEYTCTCYSERTWGGFMASHCNTRNKCELHEYVHIFYSTLLNINSLRPCRKIIIIGSDNGLSPGWHQAIISSNSGISLILTNFRNTFQWNLKQSSYILTQQNAVENVVCEMVAILSRPQWVKAINKALSTSYIWRHICCIMNGLADCYFAAHGITLPKYYVIFMNRYGPYPIHMQR